MCVPLPPASPEDLEVDRVVAHPFQGLKIFEPLHHDSGLEGCDHKQGKQRVLPIAVKKPQRRREQLQEKRGEKHTRCQALQIESSIEHWASARC